MKALTIRQPWAQLIAIGAKTIETRSWPTKHRGRIAIHAGAHRPATVWHHDANKDAPPEVDLVAMGSCWEWTENIDDYTSGGAYRWVGPLGAIVATARLDDCVPIIDEPIGDLPPGPFVYADPDWVQVHDAPDDPAPQYLEAERDLGDYSSGRWGWLLDDVKPTTERCPACWGDGGFKEDSMVLYGIPGGEDWCSPCPTCNPKGRRTEPLGVGAYGCDPIPAKGRQGLWEWTP